MGLRANQQTRVKPRMWNNLGERSRRNFLLQAAANQISGVAVYHIVGYDSDLGSTNKLIYPGTAQFVYLTESQGIKISSDDVNDTYAGTGARVIRVVGLDDQGVIQTEDVALDGTTVVYSIGDYLRVFQAFVLTAGTMAGAEGELTILHIDDTPVGTIEAPVNAMRNGHFTVPANTNAYVLRYGFNSSDTCTYCIRISTPGGDARCFSVEDMTVGHQIERPLSTHHRIPPLGIVELNAAKFLPATTYVTGDMDLLLVDADYDWASYLESEERYNQQEL